MEMILDNKKRYSGYDVIAFFDTQVLGLDELEKWFKENDGKYVFSNKFRRHFLRKVKEIKTRDLRSYVKK